MVIKFDKTKLNATECKLFNELDQRHFEDNLSPEDTRKLLLLYKKMRVINKKEILLNEINTLENKIYNFNCQIENIKIELDKLKEE